MLIKRTTGLLKTGPQVGRGNRYRGKIKVTEQDRKDHLEIDWDPSQVPATMVKKDGAKYTVGNFRWGFNETGEAKEWTPRFSDTTIDTSKVKNVYLTLQPFKPELVAAHGLIIFEMENDEAVQSSDGQKDFGVVLSVEARMPKGAGYDLMKGLKKNFGQQYQLGSLADQMQKVGRKRGHKLVLHKLELDQEQKTNLLQDALDESTEDRLGEWYHLLTNSCITADIDLINGVLPESQQMARWSKLFKFARPATMLPTIAGATLKQKGLLAKEPIKVINPELGRYPEIQHKKTDVHKVLGGMSRSALWKPALTLAGAALGGLAGLSLGGSLSDLGMLAATSAGALAGAYGGDRTADIIATKTDITVQQGTDWYQELGGLTADEARARIRNSSGS